MRTRMMLLWSRGIGQHSGGEFSIAVVQANECIEDHSQVEIGPGTTFVSVYDGHNDQRIPIRLGSPLPPSY
ncbi:hypothetical protein HPP92_027614, partial [Vanilla planifolia]